MQTDTQLGAVNVIDSRTQPKPPAKAEKEKPKEKTAEQKLWDEKAREKMHSRMFPHAKKEGEEKKAEKADDKAKEAPKAEAKETTTEEKVEAKESTDGGDGKQGKKEEAKADKDTAKPKLTPSAKKEASAPAVDYEKLATSVATAVTKGIKDSATAKDEKADDDVPEARRRDLEAIKYLEANNVKYKGKLESYKKFAKAEADYVAKWERENPGQKFDPDSEDHSAWYDRHEPEIDPDDVTEAKVELAAERKAKALVEKETSQTKRELDDFRLQRDLERAEREAQPLYSRNVGLIGGAMGDEVLKAMGELKQDETLAEKDPAAHAILTEMLPELHAKTRAATQIFGTEGRAYNAKDPAHVAIRDAVPELEKLFLEQPEDKLKDDRGRTFATLDQWASMTPEQRGSHWTINADLMSAFLANKAAEKAEQSYKNKRTEAENIAKAYGYVKTDAPAKEQKNGKHDKSETALDNTKTRSPSTSTQQVIQPGAKVDPKTSKDGGDRMLDRMFRR